MQDRGRARCSGPPAARLRRLRRHRATGDLPLGRVHRVHRAVQAFWERDLGASAAEYALLIAGIAAVVVLAVVLLGGSVGGMLDEACDGVRGMTSDGSCS